MIVADRVAKGAAWLDKNEPGWERRVLLNDLDMRSGCKCILGQVFEADSVEFPDGYCYATLTNRELFTAWDFGFDYAHDGEPDVRGPDEDWEKYTVKVEKDYDALQREWTRVIRKRQNNVA